MSNWKTIGFCRHGIFKPRWEYIEVYKKWDREGNALALKFLIITTCKDWDYFGDYPVIVQYHEENGAVQLRIRSDQAVLEKQKTILKKMNAKEFISRFGEELYQKIKIPLDQE